jgi:hypothetical protein
MCRKVARGAGGATVWRLRAVSHRSSRATRGGTSEAVEEKAAEGTALMQADHDPRRGKRL